MIVLHSPVVLLLRVEELDIELEHLIFPSRLPTDVPCVPAAPSSWLRTIIIVIATFSLLPLSIPTAVRPAPVAIVCVLFLPPPLHVYLHRRVRVVLSSPRRCLSLSLRSLRCSRGRRRRANDNEKKKGNGARRELKFKVSEHEDTRMRTRGCQAA